MYDVVYSMYIFLYLVSGVRCPYSYLGCILFVQNILEVDFLGKITVKFSKSRKLFYEDEPKVCQCPFK